MARKAPVHPLELISVGIDGEITAGEKSYLEAHLRTCVPCRDKEAELRAIDSALVAMPVPSSADAALERVLARLREEKHAASATPASDKVVAAEDGGRADSGRRYRGLWLLLGPAVAVLAAVLFYHSSDVEPERPRPLEPAPAASEAVPPPIVAPQAPAEMEPPRTEGEEISAPETPPLPVRKAAPVRTPKPQVVPEPPLAEEQLPPRTEAQQPVRSPSRTQRRWAVSSTDLMLNEARAVLHPVYFKGKSKRLNREAKQKVEAIAEFMRRHQDVHLVVRGYTDERSTIEKNLALGHERAQAVARQLEHLGIDPSRVNAVPFGVSRPEGSAAADSDNRVEFLLRP